MQKILTLIVAISIILSGCKSKPTPQEEAGLNLPAWVLDPYVDGKVAAVGIAPKSRGGLQFQIPQAEADARANIAAQLETEVSRMTKDALRSARIADNEEVENVFSQVTKSLVKKVPLRGARRINMYKDSTDGSLYIHMAIDSEMVAEHFEKNQKAYTAAIKASAAARAQLDQAEKAVQKLYDELDEELDD